MLLIMVAILAFVAIAGAGLALAGASGANQRVARRTQAIASSRGRDKAQRAAARTAPPDAGQRRKQIVRSLKENERKQRAAAFSLANRLSQAGLPVTVQAFCIGAAVFGVVAMLIALMLRQPLYLAGPIGFVAGVGLPLWLLGFLGKRRRARFVLIFADAVDIIVRGIKSGLPLQDCLKVIGKESPEPLAGEFRWLVENMALGMPLDQALDKIVERMPIPEMRFFAIVLSIQNKSGGNLGEALANLSAVVRGRRMMREKIKAMSGEAVASAFIIGSLPPLVMLLIQLTNHNYLSILFTDPRGHMYLGAGAIWMAFGIFVMRKMIDFKI